MSDTETLLRTILIIVAAVLLTPVVLMVLFAPMMGMMGMMGWGSWGMSNGMTGLSWMGLMSWLVVFLVLAGVGYVLVWGLSATENKSRNSAHDELQRAYARGDLTDGEYEERRQRLEQESNGQSSR
jgi:putative membrane protein